ncbi:MAG: DUF2093 domain-containing protein [Devosiaceae bacterium]|nr:DUF2093 domain-containing protein [Devosiaceae bacterium]
MDILQGKFSQNEAKLRYLDADYSVLVPGNFVRCAITGKTILLEDLKYWNVDRQEPYIDAEAATKAYLKYGDK